MQTLNAVASQTQETRRGRLKQKTKLLWPALPQSKERQQKKTNSSVETYMKTATETLE